MFTNLSLGALGLSASDFPTAVELAVKHGFDGIEPDLAYLRSLGDPAAIAEYADSVRERGLRWAPAGLPVNITGAAAGFGAQLAALPDTVDVLVAAGIPALGTWIRPMDPVLPYRRNWIRHVERLSLVAEILAGSGLRLGLEYIGPKTFWSTERYPFIHTLREARELFADIGTGNVGVVLDTYHWYTAGESADDLRTLTDGDIVAADVNDAPTGRTVDEQQDLDRRLPGTTGVIDLAGFTGALRDIGYGGPVKVEPFMKSLATRPIDEVLGEVGTGLRAALAG
jgi:sugar phosphate isomerase/epimerase